MIPEEHYHLINGHYLRPIKTNKKMFASYGNIIPHQYSKVMALNHLGVISHSIWKDLVMFHSFLCDDPETYDYSEHNAKFSTQIITISEPDTISNRKTKKRKIYGAGDFNHFPIEVYATSGELFKSQSDLPIKMNISLAEAEIESTEIEPEYKQEVNYRKAFELFRNLRTTDYKLYNQICLYVFAGNLKEYSEIYDNDYTSIAFYISILESQAGDPPVCKNPIQCDVCGREVLNHGTSIEKHFISKFGDDFNKLRGIRHKFFHGGAYFSILENMYDIYDNRQIRKTNPEAKVTQDLDQTEHELFDLKDEIEQLQKIARKTLIISFMSHYNNLPHG